jgi:hypothetical protein
MSGYKVDFHLHSTHSHDGESSVVDYLRRAVRLGIRGLAFTEHANHNPLAPLRAYEEAILLIEKYRLPIKVFPGAEITLETDLMVRKNGRKKPRQIHALLLAEFDLLKKVLETDDLDLEDPSLLSIIAHPGTTKFAPLFNSNSPFRGTEYSRFMGQPGSKAYQRIGLPIVSFSDAHRISRMGTYTVLRDLDLPIGQLLSLSNILGIKVTRGPNGYFDLSK